MTDLTEGQYDLDGLRLGDGTAYVVREFEDGGRPGLRQARTEYEDADGWRPGPEWHDGMELEFDILVETDPFRASDDAVGALVAAWRGDGVRTRDGAVQVLRQRRPGGETRKVYGRAGRCTPARSRNSGVGMVPVAADFSASGDRWFSDAATVVTVPIVPATTGGFVSVGGGFATPFTTAAATERPGILALDGTLDTWPVVAVTGPVSGAVVELLVGGGLRWRVEFTRAIPEGTTVTVDPRPWARTVLDQAGGNWSGRRSRRSTPLLDMTVPPGQATVIFRGVSTSGAASCTVTAEAAHPGP